MKKLKTITDSIMIILLPLLMSYALIGEVLHEWLGIAMFTAFILHHILNHKWLTSIFKGKYTPYRIYINALNILLCVIMLALPISGILMSRHAVPFLSITSGASLARSVHMTTSYWGFVLMSVHLGNHAGMIMNGMRRMFGIKSDSRTRTVILRIILGLISAYGIYAFIKLRIASYMFMQIQFAFFDPSESKAAFFADYICIIAAFAIAGYYLGELLKRASRSKDRNEVP